MENNDLKICVVGLGYVGLPLAVEFGKIRETLGFDIDKERIKNLEKDLIKRWKKARKKFWKQNYSLFLHLQKI